MALQFRCSKCGELIKTEKNAFGKTVECPKCKTEFAIPVASPCEAETKPADPLVGQKIAHYKIESLIGRGGMGKVYKARNLRLDKTCALKMLPAEFAKQDRGLIERFIREARSAASIQHSNVLPVYFIGLQHGQYFIEMDYIDGGTLEDRLATMGHFEPREAARIIRDVAAALAAAHANDIIHRDIKPSNVMLTKDGQVKVSDFGLAKVSSGRTGLTVTGLVIGTPLYMSPEQAESRHVDHRSDIYSLGVMFYQLLTGKPPYTADSPAGLIYRHVHTPLPDPAKAGVPPRLAAIVTKMTAKKPEERYQSCEQVVKELDEFLALTAAEQAAAVPSEGKSRTRRRKTALFAAVAAVVMLLAVAGAFLTPRRDNVSSRSASPAADSPDIPVPPTTKPKPKPTPSSYDDVYLTTAATGEKIPHPLSRKTYKILHEGKYIDVPEGMVYIPAGPFLMGAPDSNEWYGFIQKEVYLDAYFIDKYEVTNAQYMEFVKAADHPMPEHWVRNGGKIPEGRENHPVVNVSWEDAKAYCDWCGKRLPTEAEWEKAAAWDMKRKRHREYPWGNSFSPRAANHCYQLACQCNGDAKIHTPWWLKWSKTELGRKLIALGGNTAPVGRFKDDVSFFNCFDMGGNVCEWVNDWWKYDYYKVGPTINPPGPTKEEADDVVYKDQKLGPCRVMRGGCWFSGPNLIRTAHRDHSVPTDPPFKLGFRCAADYPRKPVQPAHKKLQ